MGYALPILAFLAAGIAVLTTTRNKETGKPTAWGYVAFLVAATVMVAGITKEWRRQEELKDRIMVSVGLLHIRLFDAKNELDKAINEIKLFPANSSNIRTKALSDFERIVENANDTIAPNRDYVDAALIFAFSDLRDQARQAETITHGLQYDQSRDLMLEELRDKTQEIGVVVCSYVPDPADVDGSKCQEMWSFNLYELSAS